MAVYFNDIMLAPAAPTNTSGYIYSKTILDTMYYLQDIIDSNNSSFPIIPEHISVLVSSIMHSVYEGETTGICPDDFRRDFSGRYRYKAIVGGIRSCYFSNGVFYAILQERLFQFSLSKCFTSGKKLKIIFTAGTSGSGKSTIISKICQDTRGIIFYDATQSSKKYRQLCVKRIRRYITTLLAQLSHNIEDFVELICVNVNTPLDICIQRNSKIPHLADTEVSTRLRYNRLMRFPPSIEDGFNHVCNISTEEEYCNFLENYLSDDIPTIEAGDRRPHREC